MIRTRPSRDEARYERLRSLGCIACRIDGGAGCGPVEIHHLVDKGYKKHSGGNQATIPLGSWHHRGQPYIDTSTGYMRALHGPSMFFEAKAFAEKYGSQRTLLAKVNELIVNQQGETNV